MAQLRQDAMATTQATFGDVEPTETEPETAADTETVPRRLDDPGELAAGDEVSLRGLDHSDTHTIVKTTAKTLTVDRNGSDLRLARESTGQFRTFGTAGKTAISREVWIVGTADAPVIECSECGESIDPAAVGHRSDYTYTCQECHE